MSYFPSRQVNNQKWLASIFGDVYYVMRGEKAKSQPLCLVLFPIYFFPFHPKKPDIEDNVFHCFTGL